MEIKITIEEERLVKAMAMIADLSEFIQQEHGSDDLLNALDTAIETMQAFYFAYFEDADVEVNDVSD